MKKLILLLFIPLVFGCDYFDQWNSRSEAKFLKTCEPKAEPYAVVEIHKSKICNCALDYAKMKFKSPKQAIKDFDSIKSLRKSKYLYCF